MFIELNRNLTKMVLIPDESMAIADDYYDALTCIAALSQGHIRPELLRVSVVFKYPG